MKKSRALIMIVATILILFTSVMALADSKMFTLLDNATVGYGQIIQIPYKVYKLWVCEVPINGQPDNVTLALEGNVSGGALFLSMLDNQDTLDVPPSNINKGIYIFNIPNSPVKAMRARVVSMTGGINPRISMLCIGVE